MDLDRFRRLPLLGILRGIGAEHVPPLVEAIVSAGLETIEITMNTEDAADLIADMVRQGGDRLTVGAGTVLSSDDLDRARDAGASFIVMPTLVRDVVNRCVVKGIPVFPGALTPREIHEAWTAGATMVKVFPASCFGPAYLKEIKGPFRNIELLACGGVSAENMAAYFSAGASATAFGGSVFRPAWLEAGRYDRIGDEITRLVSACRAALPGT